MSLIAIAYLVVFVLSAAGALTDELADGAGPARLASLLGARVVGFLAALGIWLAHVPALLGAAGPPLILVAALVDAGATRQSERLTVAQLAPASGPVLQQELLGLGVMYGLRLPAYVFGAAASMHSLVNF